MRDFSSVLLNYEVSYDIESGGFDFFSIEATFSAIIYMAFALFFSIIVVSATKSSKKLLILAFIPYIGVFILTFVCIISAGRKNMSSYGDNNKNTYINNNVRVRNTSSNEDKRYSTINSHYANTTVNRSNANRSNANQSSTDNRVLNNLNVPREIEEFDATKATLNECNTHEHGSYDSYDFYNFETTRTYKLNGEIVEYNKNVCKHCGGVIKAFSRKCPECGAKIRR